MEHAADKTRPRRTTRKPTPSQALLTCAQVEIETGIPYRTLYDLFAAGHLPAVRLPGQRRRLWFRRQDVAALIENNLTKRKEAAA